MKTSTNTGTRTITATEQSKGEAEKYRLVINRYGSVADVSGPLVPVVAPPPPPPPAVNPVARITVSPTSLSLRVGDRVTLGWDLFDTANAPATGRAVTFASTNTALVAFDGSTVAALAKGAASVSITSEGITVSIPVVVADAVVLPPPPPPVIVPLPSIPATLSKIVGPLPDVVKASAKHASFAKYLNAWSVLEATRWTANAPDNANWGNTNYYDRACIDYAFAIMYGNATLMAHAHAQALNYRKNYLEAAQFLIQPHWSMMDGVAAHFLATGDEASRVAVGRIADLFVGLTYRDNIGSKIGTDNRVQARYLVAVLLAHLIQAPSTGVPAGGIPGGHVWADELRRALTLILSTQDADGAFRLSDCGDGGPRAVHPFTTGLLMDALVRYFDLFEADPRIPNAITRAAAYLWVNDWLPADGAFKYVERVCAAEGGPAPAADLNGILLRGFAFVYRLGKDPIWYDRSIQILNGSFNAWLSPDKQINQTYTSGFRALSDLVG